MEFLNSSDGLQARRTRRPTSSLPASLQTAADLAGLCDPAPSSDLALSAFVCSVIYNTADSCLIEENAIYIGQSLLPPS